MSGGIKRRARTIDTEALEAFSAGADTRTAEPVLPRSTPKATPPRIGDTRASTDEPLPKSMEVRFADGDLPRRIRDLAAREDRSRHKIALMALELGLNQLEQ